MWTQEMFGVEKPIIALLHLDALPGDPGYCGSMDTVLEHARQDLVALQNGGVDGILFANEFSLPYQPVADVAVISAMGLYHRRSAPADPGALWRQCGQESHRDHRPCCCYRRKICPELLLRCIHGRIWPLYLQQR